MTQPVSTHPTNAKGAYANYFEVGHTAFEFVLDFGEAYQGGGLAPCHTRIVTTPVYVLALLDVLSRAVADYQSQFGCIKEAK
jgi:hypothetical protein